MGILDSVNTATPEPVVTVNHLAEHDVTVTLAYRALTIRDSIAD